MPPGRSFIREPATLHPRLPVSRCNGIAATIELEPAANFLPGSYDGLGRGTGWPLARVCAYPEAARFRIVNGYPAATRSAGVPYPSFQLD